MASGLFRAILQAAFLQVALNLCGIHYTGCSRRVSADKVSAFLSSWWPYKDQHAQSFLDQKQVALSPAPSSECVKLLVIGDYGSRDQTQKNVAASMAAVAAEFKPAAIAGIGDNIYDDGAKGNPQLIVDWWSDIYLKHEALQIPWYIVTGNHDWHTDARTERDFTAHPFNTKRGGYWNMPAFWYKKSFKTDQVSVDSFFIDTEIWLQSPMTRRVLGKNAKQEQIDWLTAELKASTADWKIVLGHHPVYSAGSHGITKDLLDELDPLMRQYGVQILFSGHDHSKQLMQHRGLNYIVSGAGGAPAYGPRSEEYPAGSQKEMFEGHGFASLSICSTSTAVLKFYGENGDVQATQDLPSTRPEAMPEVGTPALAKRPSQSGSIFSATPVFGVFAVALVLLLLR